MLLNLSDLSDEPLQSQIARQIRAKILSGELEAGYMLPSIRALAREQTVSVITVQRGYELLENDGLILSRRGKGYFVNELQIKEKKDLAKDRFKEKLQPVIKNALNEGMTDEEIRTTVEELIKSNK